MRLSPAVAVAAVLGLVACHEAAERTDPAVGVDTLAASDGVPIVYDVRGRGDVALVFIHCWGCDRRFWREQLDAFAPEYRVVSLDLAGHGASGSGRATWSLAGLADDVANLVRTLGLRRVVLIGHSMGGPVAVLAAARLPGIVLGVACAESLHDVSTPITQATVDQMLVPYQRDYPGTMSQMVGMMFPPWSDTALVRWVAGEALRADTAATLGLVRDYPNLDLETAFVGAGVPIRCINAAPRPPMGPATAVEVNRRYADFDAVLMDSVGHYLQLERPVAFNARLQAILLELGAMPDTTHD